MFHISFTVGYGGSRTGAACGINGCGLVRNNGYGVGCGPSGCGPLGPY